jgi:hypothetical protein
LAAQWGLFSPHSLSSSGLRVCKAAGRRARGRASAPARAAAQAATYGSSLPDLVRSHGDVRAEGKAHGCCGARHLRRNVEHFGFLRLVLVLVDQSSVLRGYSEKAHHKGLPTPRDKDAQMRTFQPLSSIRVSSTFRSGGAMEARELVRLCASGALGKLPSISAAGSFLAW